jgi:hypothetical protein
MHSHRDLILEGEQNGTEAEVEGQKSKGGKIGPTPDFCAMFSGVGMGIEMGWIMEILCSSTL